MTFFELLAGASLSLALAIPVFVDKIMRPRYEERFGEFRQQNRLQFFSAFENALEKLRRVKRSAETLTPEVYETMEDLFLKWGRLRSNETRLDTLLARRKYLFVGWIIGFVLSAFAAGFPDVVIGQATISQLALWFFLAMLAYSVYYVVQLFDLDDKVSKFTGTPFGSEADESPPYSRPITQRGASLFEQEIAKGFQIEGIPYELNPKLSGTYRPDFAIPSSKNPLFFVEIKGMLTKASTGGWLNYDSRGLKSTYPGVKTMIVSIDLTSKMRRLLSKYWDYVFDYSEIHRVMAILKTALGKPASKGLS